MLLIWPLDVLKVCIYTAVDMTRVKESIELEWQIGVGTDSFFHFALRFYEGKETWTSFLRFAQKLQ
jgi:hypothetical protein